MPQANIRNWNAAARLPTRAKIWPSPCSKGCGLKSFLGRLIALLLLLAPLGALCQYVTVVGNIQAANGLPAANNVINFTPSQWFFVAGTGVVVNTTTNCATSIDGSVVGLPNPLEATIVTAGFLGTLPAGNYYVEYAWYVGAALTLPSPEVQVQQQMGGSLTVQAPASGKPAGATGMVVYIGASSGAETRQGTTTGLAPWVQQVPLVSGVAPATINNTVCQQVANDAGWPVGTGYNVSLVDPSGNTIPGYPMLWQLLGAGSTINLSTGLPYYHGVVTFPSPILASPQNHTPQSISGPLNLGGYALTGVGSLNVTGEINAAYLPPTIANAIAEAGTAGSVLIPGNYGGTDYFTGNQHNVRIQDSRPRNPLDNLTQTFPSIMPETTVKAADYGAACDGTHDDTAAIQDAVNALTNVIGITQLPPQPLIQPAVELPQGRCVLSGPITLLNYGSIVGAPGGTWLGASGSWTGGTAAMINIAENYNATGTGPNGQQQTAVNRQVRNINFEYNGSAAAITAIKVYNQTGSQAFPYPSTADHNAQPYQIPGVLIEGVSVYAMDTGIDLEDCGNCTIMYPQINAVRNGIVLGGNDYSTNIIGGVIEDGLYTYTPISSGGRNGIYSTAQVRYSCTSGTGANCTGGTINQDTTVSPQTLGLYGVTVESFDTNANIANCLNLIAGGNDFDSAIGLAMYMGQLKFSQVYNNEMATSSTTSDVIQVAALTSSQTSGLENADGNWITDNIVYAYNPTSGFGLDFLSGGGSGANARRNTYIQGNSFANVAYGVDMQSALQYSVLTGNYGNSITTDLFNFPLTASGSYSNVSFHDNTATSFIPCHNAEAGTGLVVGWNSCGNSTSGGQLTGTQIATGSGCSVTSSVGNNCLATMTIPQTYLDANYTVSGCQPVGASANIAMGLVVKTNGSQFGVYENSLGTAASGGTISCTVNHQ